MSRFTRTFRRTIRAAHLRLVFSSDRSAEENLRSVEAALARVRNATSFPAPPMLEPSLPQERPFELSRNKDHAQLQQEINGCKSLLLEIIRRAAYDWVLYRTSRRMVQRKLAEQAFHWLFVEDGTGEDKKEREDSEKYITSFLAICEALDLDPESVRKHVRKLTPKNVMSVGRPAEYRRRDNSPSLPQEASVALGSRALPVWSDNEDPSDD
jgi:hypothetical protein